MGTALVMEHANALAQMIVSEKDKLFDERVEALVKLYRRAEFYLKQGFLESIVCEFHRKKVEIILGCICIALGIALSSYSLYNVWTTLDIDTYLHIQNSYSTLIEDNYVNPSQTTITFPEKKRNLIYIYLESMESTYSDKKRRRCLRPQFYSRPD